MIHIMMQLECTYNDQYTFHWKMQLNVRWKNATENPRRFPRCPFSGAQSFVIVVLLYLTIIMSSSSSSSSSSIVIIMYYYVLLLLVLLLLVLLLLVVVF